MSFLYSHKLFSHPLATGKRRRLCYGKFSVCWLILTLLSFFIASTAVAKNRSVTLQLDGDHQFRYAGFYAAKWNGYYEDAGLDVHLSSQLNEVGTRRDVIRSVVNGDAEFGLSDAQLLVAKDRGDPVTVLAVILQRSGVELYTNASDSRASPVDLANLSILPTHDPALRVAHDILQNVLGSRDATYGAAYPAEALSKVTPEEATLGDSLLYPYEAMQLSKDVLPVRLEHHGVDLPGSSIFTTLDMLNKRPELVEAFVLASLRGWRFALQNSDAVAMRLTRERMAVGRHRELFGINFYQIDKVRELSMYPIVPLGNNSAERWERAHQQLLAAGLVTQPFSADGFVYDPVKALKERAARTEHWIRHGLVMFFSFVLFAATAYWGYWIQQKKSAGKLFREANYDAVTGLPNRTFTLRYLASAIAKQRSLSRCVSVFFIDLDGFKRVNDNFGHSIGDLLLSATASRLNELCKAGTGDSHHVARLGGDEFLIIANDLTTVDIQQLAVSVLSEMNRLFNLAGKEIHIGASVGVATVWSGGCSGDKLLKRADAAMYFAKTSGRGQYKVYDNQLGNALQQKVDIETELSLAIARGELSVHYQPIVSIDSGLIVGAEALLRWHNGRLGNVPPDRFIAVAEETGLIDDIGHWVLQTAIAQLSVWQHDFNAEFELAVNISPRQFNDSDFYQRLVHCAEVAGVKPSTLKLEITEGLLASSNRDTTVLLQRIAQAGFGISIDDFGTGYSSLNYLRHFPAKTLKVDRSFVSELFNDERNQALVRAIVRMAHSLGMSVVAEGIETVQQEEFLRLQECDYVQGYLYGKPVPVDTFTDILAGSCSGQRLIKSTQTEVPALPAGRWRQQTKVISSHDSTEKQQLTA